MKFDKSLFEKKIGKDRVDLWNKIAESNTLFSPYSITKKDIDSGVYSFFLNGEGKVVLTEENSKARNKKGTAIGNVPIFFPMGEKWAEQQKVDQYADEYNNLMKPFMLLRRLGSTKGSRLGSGVNYYKNMKMPFFYGKTINNGEECVALIEVPQPTNVDLKYDIIFVSNYVSDLNVFDETFRYIFASGEISVMIKNQWMRMMLEDIDETIEAADDKKVKYYTQKMSIVFKGFLWNKKDFKITTLQKIKSINVGF